MRNAILKLNVPTDSDIPIIFNLSLTECKILYTLIMETLGEDDFSLVIQTTVDQCYKDFRYFCMNSNKNLLLKRINPNKLGHFMVILEITDSKRKINYPTLNFFPTTETSLNILTTLVSVGLKGLKVKLQCRQKDKETNEWLPFERSMFIPRKLALEIIRVPSAERSNIFSYVKGLKVERAGKHK